MKEPLTSQGVLHQKTALYSPQENGRTELDLRTIIEAVSSMIHAKEFPLLLWEKVVQTDVFVLNRTSSKVADISYFQEFGATAYVHVSKDRCWKLDSKDLKGILVG